ncbi:MAG: MerR family transcriptional regulator [Methylophilaceae bacterium]|nr:MerR family transcriptional regulator [Methylophilaceae bacterium]
MMTDNPGLPSIPAKNYFTIGETSRLCAVKPHVLRYWEQEFSELKPAKRRGNRRYYQPHELVLIRTIRSLLYEQHFTIEGARTRLRELAHAHPKKSAQAATPTEISSQLRNIKAQLAAIVALLEV